MIQPKIDSDNDKWPTRICKIADAVKSVLHELEDSFEYDGVLSSLDTDSAFRLADCVFRLRCINLVTARPLHTSQS